MGDRIAFEGNISASFIRSACDANPYSVVDLSAEEPGQYAYRNETENRASGVSILIFYTFLVFTFLSFKNCCFEC